jgi:hypothetical protein
MIEREWSTNIKTYHPQLGVGMPPPAAPIEMEPSPKIHPCW